MEYTIYKALPAAAHPSTGLEEQPKPGPGWGLSLAEGQGVEIPFRRRARGCCVGAPSARIGAPSGLSTGLRRALDSPFISEQ